jgi:predicted TIM-barrel fold metal-dependent hydrolase
MKKRDKELSSGIGRREFLTYIGGGAVGTAVASKLSGGVPEAHASPSRYDVMKEVMKYRKIDAHVHIHLPYEPAYVIKEANRLGIDKLALSIPVIGKREANPDEFRENNDLIIKAMKQYPGRITPQLTLNPRYRKESLEEIDRCMDYGFVGLKVYYQVKINDPLFYPIIERCIELKLMILMHAEAELGVGGYRMKYDIDKAPNTSIPDDFVEVARRYPEAMLQFAHIGGGGDWEYMCKTLRDSTNVVVDTSGSNNDEGLINFAMRTLGEDRLLFGTDNCFYQGVGKILAANLNERQRKKIFFDNYNNILRKAGNNVD